MNLSEAWNARDGVKDMEVFPAGAKNREALPEKELLSSEQEKRVVEIIDSLDKNRGGEREGKIKVSSGDDSNVSTYSFKHRKGRAEEGEVWEEKAILTAQTELNALLDHLEPERAIPREQSRQTDAAPSPPSHVSDLVDHTKQQLAGMKAFATFAKDKFRDPELGIRYQKAFSRRINEAMALLDAYADYLSLRNPKKKINTINRLLEEVLMKHTEQLKDRQIEVINKQFAEDLPETWVPEAQLEYVFDSLMRYITHSTPPHGNLGLLTRWTDDSQGNGGANDPLGKDRRYVEILFVFSTQDKKNDSPSSSYRGQGMGLILLLTQEIMEKNKGFMEVKPSDKNAMTFISLKVPVERRTVLEFKPLKPIKQKGTEMTTATHRVEE